MSGASEARDALRQAARAVYVPTHAAGASYAKAYQALVAQDDLVAAMGSMVEVIIAAERLQEVAGEAVKIARSTLASTMNDTGATQIASGHHLAYLSRKPAFLNIDQPDLVPAEYMRQPEPVIDKKAIKEAIEAGVDVPGCSIVRPNELGLGIKGKKP